jgi:hypothetical protein
MTTTTTTTTVITPCSYYNGINIAKIIQCFFSVEINRTSHRILSMKKIIPKADNKINLLKQNIIYVISSRIQAIQGLFKLHGS